MRNSKDTSLITRLSVSRPRRLVLPAARSTLSGEVFTLLEFTSGSDTSARIADRGSRLRSKRSSLMSKEDLFKLINDRLEGWELAEIIQLSAEDICLSFEDEVLDKITAIRELLNIDTIDDGEEEETFDYDEYD